MFLEAKKSSTTKHISVFDLNASILILNLSWLKKFLPGVCKSRSRIAGWAQKKKLIGR